MDAPAFHKIKARRKTPLFIFGDHASRVIPKSYSDLGITGDDLTRHIAYDIGTQTIIEALCDHFGCGGIMAGVSRLLIDCNRDVRSEGLIPKISDGTIIPGNQNISAAERAERIERYYAPYHQNLSDMLKRDDDPLIVSIHSFTPKPHTGDWRDIEIGFLYKGDIATTLAAHAEFKNLARDGGRDFTLGLNEPYSAFDLNYTVDAHVIPRGLRHLTLEIRQDLIDSDKGAKDMAMIIAQVLKPLIRVPYPDHHKHETLL